MPDINLVAKKCNQLSASSQINSRDASGQTPLHLACERGDTVCMKELLEESQARTDIKDRNGDTPMHCAAKQDSSAIIQVRLSWSDVPVKSPYGLKETITMLNDLNTIFQCQQIQLTDPNMAG